MSTVSLDEPDAMIPAPDAEVPTATAEDSEASAGANKDTGKTEGKEGGFGAAVAAAAPAPAVEPEPSLSPVEHLSVQVDFEVGRATIPISELANIGEGSVLATAGVERGRVLAKSGGQAFAVGEFVDIGGRIGFRITEILNAALSRPSAAKA